MSDAPEDEAALKSDGSAQREAKSRLAYLASLPERTLRTGVGVLGGAARETAGLLVPRSFQSSRTYSVMVRQMLDFLVHDVGGVEQQNAASSTAGVDNYVARKAVGNFVDMASLATLHLSPVLILAAVGDLAYGSQTYLKELAKELEQQGIIDSADAVQHVNDLLTAVSDTSAATTEAFNTPPLSVAALRETIEQTRAAILKGTAVIPPRAEVERMWQEMREISLREHVGLLTVSATATLRSLDKFAKLGRGALSSVKVTGSLFDKHVLDHYQQAFVEIRERGVFTSLAESSGPYVAAVWKNFQPAKGTLTEDILSGKLAGSSWRTVRKWLGRGPEPPPDEPPDEGS
jgi:hypothetical protein